MTKDLQVSGEFVVSEQDKEIIQSIFTKLSEAKKQGKATRLLELDDLHGMLSTNETRLLGRIYAINPIFYGIKSSYIGIEPIPDDLIEIAPQNFYNEGRMHTTRAQYLPQPTFKAFEAMASALKRDLGRPLLITSSYRTSVRQALTFLSILQAYAYDVPKTLKRVAIPGYSEHGTPSKQALDFQNIDGLPSFNNPIDFEHTVEYMWLQKNAAKFDFYLSYPKDNPQGIMFEPWHWRHIPNLKD
jgi:LAS superfamily LD-carboxypeptidase LdcB